jgi:ribonuclease III
MSPEQKNTKPGSKKKKNRQRQLINLQNKIKVRFDSQSLLNRSLTHRSYINEVSSDISDNERLEYLGDSVLALVVNEYLFKSYEKYVEGDLAKIKSAVVSEATLCKIAEELNLGSYILMGRGEEQSGGRERASILANTLEALIGAIYLDSGLKSCKKFILGVIKKDIERIDSQTYLRDPKTTLQEFVQKKYKERPVYEVINETGPDHQKEFTVRLIINGRDMMTGIGKSKRRAEMEAAKKLLEIIQTGEVSI